MSVFFTLLIKDLLSLIIGIGIFVVINRILGNKIKDPIMQGVLVSFLIVGFSGCLVTHYGNIHSIKDRIILMLLFSVVLSISMVVMKSLRHKRAQA